MNKLTIRATLTSIVAIFVIMLVGGSAVGFFAVRSGNAALQQMTQSEVKAARLLSESGEALLQAHVALVRANMLYASDVTADAKTALGSGRELLDRSSAVWAQYVALQTAAHRDGGVAAASQARDAVLDQAFKPELAALSNLDLSTYGLLVTQTMPALLAGYEHAIDVLKVAQQHHADALMSDARQRLVVLNAMIAAALVIALLFATYALWVLRREVILPLGEAAGHFHRIAAGDLSNVVVVRSKNEIGTVFEAINAMQRGMSGTLRSIRESAGLIDVGAREIATGNTDLSSRTEEQASSLQQTASSMAHLTETVRQNTDNARQARQLAANASDIASRGGEVVGEVVTTMQAIAGSSDKIVDIIAVIEGIAFQTNILALNAAVEAARAGEEGRGFAVVANEVRSLAQRSAGAAKEIKSLIDDSAQKVHSGSALVSRAGDTMEEIVQAVRRVTDIMGEISAASEEQKGGIEQVNQAVTQMDQVTQQNAALVEEAAAAAASLEVQTHQLRGVLDGYRLDTNDGVTHRAAAPAVTTGRAARASAALSTMPLPSKVASKVRTQATAARHAVSPAGAKAMPAVKAVTKAVAARKPALPAVPGKTMVTARPVSASRAVTVAAGRAIVPVAKMKTAAADGEWETF
ncbi:methyl-accepting chemotaxis protein [Robbsia betulipollinis]|uniref:methyl-accepting chemotaxis protein n=1 Tax=Robbsia betulipollinis TaxID=2981849 RepID=UPI002546462A|nr:methyl-accepting chemotaxis protein [Robbsia betulipollinis]